MSRHHVVRQTLGPEIREETALASVAQEAAELTSGTGPVMGVIVRQREAEVEMIPLREEGRITARKCDESQIITSLTGTINSLSPSWSFRKTGDLQIV